MGLNTETTQAAERTVVPAANTVNTSTFPRKTRFRFNKDDKTGIQRNAVEVEIQVPSLQGLISIIKDGMSADPETEEGKKSKKTMDYLIELAGDAIVKEVRSYVSDNANAAQDTIDWKNFTFSAIANMPAGIRGASSISKEVWEAFTKDYVAVMVAANIPAEVAAIRCSVFTQKFRPLTGNPERKSIIESLMGTLAVYIDKSTKVDEFSDILEFLTKKADDLKKEDSIVTANALGF